MQRGGFINGALYQSQEIVDTLTYTAKNKTVILADCVTAGGIITITLPDAATVDNILYYIKKIDVSSYKVVIAVTGGQLIDGAADLTIYSPNVSYSIASDGSNWHILNSGQAGQTIKIITTGETLDAAFNTILCNNSGDITVILPPAANFINRTMTIKKISATGAPDKIVTINGNVIGETIDGQTELKIYTQYTSYSLLSDGLDWHIIG